MYGEGYLLVAVGGTGLAQSTAAEWIGEMGLQKSPGGVYSPWTPGDPVTIPFSFTVYAGQASEIDYWLRVHADNGQSFEPCAATGGICNVAQIGESVATSDYSHTLTRRLTSATDWFETAVDVGITSSSGFDYLVPEPGISAALLAALGTLGFLARRHARRAALVAAAISVAASQTASAGIFCVTDETELRAALATIGSSFDGADNEVRLTQRIFFNGGFVFQVQVSGPTGNLDVSGGWTTAGDTACDVQEIDARSHRARCAARLGGAVDPAQLGLRRGPAVDLGVEPDAAQRQRTRRSHRPHHRQQLRLDHRRQRDRPRPPRDELAVPGRRGDHAGLVVARHHAPQFARLRQRAFFLGPTFPLASVLFTSLSLNPDRNWRVTNNTIEESPDSASK